MDLDFRTNQFELFQDWTENDTKKKFTVALNKQATEEKRTYLLFYRQAIFAKDGEWKIVKAYIITPNEMISLTQF